MAIYHCSVKNSRSNMKRGGSPTPAAAHRDYIMREGKFADREESLIAAGTENMPEWAEENPRDFWEAADEHERANGRTYIEVEIALPHELTREQQIELAEEFGRELFGVDHPYEYAIHSDVGALDGEQLNTHVHFQGTERRLDGIERDREEFFRRANTEHLEQGGAKKDRDWNAKDNIDHIRELWERTCNRALERAGHDVRIDRRTLADQRQEALEKGDHAKAAELDRQPEEHLGPDRAAQKNKPPLTQEEIERIALHRYTRGLNRELKQNSWELKKADYALRKEERATRKEVKNGQPTAKQQAELDRLAAERHEVYKEQLLNDLRQKELTAKLDSPEAKIELAQMAGDIAKRDQQRLDKLYGIKSGREKNAAAIARAAAEKLASKDLGRDGQDTKVVSYGEILYGAADGARDTTASAGDKEVLEKLRDRLLQDYTYTPSKARVEGDIADPANLARQADKILEQLEREKAQRQAIETEQSYETQKKILQSSDLKEHVEKATKERAEVLAKALENEKAKGQAAAEVAARTDKAQEAIKLNLQDLAGKIERREVTYTQVKESLVAARRACEDHLRDLRRELASLPPAKVLTNEEIREMAIAWHRANVMKDHSEEYNKLKEKVQSAEAALEKARNPGNGAPPADPKKIENLEKIRDAASKQVDNKFQELKDIARADAGAIRDYMGEIKNKNGQDVNRRKELEAKIDVFGTKSAEVRVLERAMLKSIGKPLPPAIGDAVKNVASDMDRMTAHGKGGLNLRIAALHQDLGDCADRRGHGADVGDDFSL